MASLKDQIISMLKNMPDDADSEDIIEAIILKQKVLNGLKDSEAGNYYTHEQAKEILEKWLKSDG
jgi:hypothetical protein